MIICSNVILNTYLGPTDRSDFNRHPVAEFSPLSLYFIKGDSFRTYTYVEEQSIPRSPWNRTGSDGKRIAEKVRCLWIGGWYLQESRPPSYLWQAGVLPAAQTTADGGITALPDRREPASVWVLGYKAPLSL